LLGCTVSPGFEFSDFELAAESDLQEYYRYKTLINRMVRR